MSKLLEAIRTVAREDQAEMAAVPPDVIPFLSGAMHARIADEILRAQSQPPSRQRQPESTVEFAPPPRDALAARRAERPAKRRVFTFGFGFGGLALAAAAALLLWTRPSGDGPALPAYSVIASGGVSELRGGSGKSDVDTNSGATADRQRIRPESDLRIICRPDRATDEPPAVRTFLVQGNSAAEVAAQVEIAPSGSVDVHLRGGDLTKRYQGVATLRVVVGRPSRVGAMNPQAAVDATDGPAWRWLSVPLDLER